MRLLQAMWAALREMLIGPGALPEAEEQPAEKLPAENLEPEATGSGEEADGGRLATLPMKSPAVLRRFAEGNQDLVFDYVLGKMKKAVARNASRIRLFRLGESRLISTIERADFADTLNRLIEFYLAKEEYEKVSVCKKLLDRHHVNQVIGESRET